MGRVTSTQSTETSISTTPYQQKKISVLSSTGWQAGDYVYAGPGSTGYGFNQPANTNFPLTYAVKQGIASIGSTVSLNTRSAMTGPMSVSTVYTGTSITPDTASGSEYQLATSYNQYQSGVCVLNNGNIVTVQSNYYYPCYWQIHDAAGNSINQGYAGDYSPSYWSNNSMPQPSALANGGFIIPCWSDSYYKIAVFNSNGLNWRNHTYIGSWNASMQYGCASVGFSGGGYAAFFAYSASNMSYAIYDSAGTQIVNTTFSIANGNSIIGLSATPIGTNKAILAVQSSNGYYYTHLIDGTTGAVGPANMIGNCNPSYYNMIYATTMTNGNAVVAVQLGTTTYNYAILNASNSTVTASSLSVPGLSSGSAGFNGVTYLPSGGFAVGFSYVNSSYNAYHRYDSTGTLLTTSAPITMTSSSYGQSTSGNLGRIFTTANGEVGCYFRDSSNYSKMSQLFSTMTLTQNVTVLSANTITPKTGNVLLGVSTNDVTAGEFGEVIVSGVAHVSNSYPSVSGTLGFNFKNNSDKNSYGNSGTVNGRTVILKGI